MIDRPGETHRKDTDGPRVEPQPDAQLLAVTPSVPQAASASPAKYPKLRADALEGGVIRFVYENTVVNAFEPDLTDPIKHLAFSADAGTLAVSSDRQIIFYDLTERMEASEVGRFSPFHWRSALNDKVNESSAPQKITHVALNPSGSMAAIAFPDKSVQKEEQLPGQGKIVLIDVARIEERGDMHVPSTPGAIRFSEDGKDLVVDIPGRADRSILATNEDDSEQRKPLL